ncbi:alpha-protein kinase vwkA-like [Elysia marginata]|uniref:Alpha-protein kinase vwkA-like n=1 Tax=Elysia marginata TaxID=1093978 RepID=A0AAV4FC83_9GAST|nr:alpha-protein kinase vwkA-like [Elysia marginata]
MLLKMRKKKEDEEEVKKEDEEVKKEDEEEVKQQHQLQAHSGCVGTASHDGLYPDLSPFQSLRRERACSAVELNTGGTGCRLSSCERRASLRHLHVNTNQCLNERNNNSNKNNIRGSSSGCNDNKIIHNGNRNRYLYADWDDEDKTHSNMFSFQNCTLQSEEGGNGDSYWVSFEEKSFCKGKAFKVYSGKMNGRGKKSGDRCVVKVFRKCMGTKSLCSCEMKKSETASELARAYNKSAQKRDVYLRFAATYWALMDEVSRLKTIFFSGERPLSSKEAVLFEDDVRMDGERPNKTRRLSSFMDARGRPGTSRATELDAFTHFSYHQSGGRLVVCGLEGVHDSEGFFLKTPTIHSRAREFGNSDGGLLGIREVFRHHVCNNLCKDMSKPSPDEDGSERGDNFPLIADCATSGIPAPLNKNKDVATPSQTWTIPDLSTQSSQLSHLTTFSDTTDSVEPREIPSAPELPFDHHDLSRSLSCPPASYENNDPSGASWITRDGRHQFNPITRLMPDPKASYMHQNSLPNTLLVNTPQVHRVREPVSIHSATMNMVDLHIQDENANPWSHTSINTSTPVVNRFDAVDGRADSTGAASSAQTSFSKEIQSVGRGLTEEPVGYNPMLSASTPRRTNSQLPDPGLCHGSSPGDSSPAQACSSLRQSPQHDDALYPLPDYPPSYMDSQIATAYWVMQRGYGCIPATVTPTQYTSPWEQRPSKPQGRRFQGYPGNQ